MKGKNTTSNEKIAERYFKVKYLRRFKAIHQHLTGFWRKYPKLYENEKDWDRQVRRILRNIEADFYRDVDILLNIRNGDGGARGYPPLPQSAVSGKKGDGIQDYTGLDISGNKCNSKKEGKNDDGENKETGNNAYEGTFSEVSVESDDDLDTPF